MFEFADEKWLFELVTEDDIIQAEEKLGMQFPEQLRTFYLEAGAGYLIDPEEAATDLDRLLSPLEVIQIRNREGEFAQYARYLLKSSTEQREKEGDLIFFQIDHATYLTIASKDSGAIYYNKLKIAENLKEFIEKELEDHHYFYNLYSEEEKDILNQIKRLKGMDLG